MAIHKPVTVIMIVVSLIALGLVSLDRLPLEFLMRVDVPILTCYIPYPGALPEQVEREVAIPAEAEFMTLGGLQRISTWSDTNGCNILIRYDWDMKMSMAAADLRDRIERLKLKLPEEVDRIFIRRYSSDMSPVLRFALFRQEDQDALAQWARTVLKNRLMRIKGVADVEVSGREQSEVSVEFDQGALRSRNLGLYDVVQTLQQANVNVSAGQLDEGRHRYFVRIQDEIVEPEQLRNLVVSPAGVRLSEIAEVKEVPPEGATDFSVDGQSGVFVNVLRESEANTVAVCDAIHAELAQIRREPGFESVDTFVFEDQAEIIRYALGQLRTAGIAGSFLAFAVLFLFLWNMRATLLVSLMTPASLVVAFVFLYFTGRSLNLVTIAAMIVSLGMLVDNAIVVIENIHQHYRPGIDRTENACHGAEQVGLAITASTLTTVVVFIPVLYLDAGELSLIMREFSGPMVLSLLASLVLALTVLPLAESRLARLMPDTSRRPGKRWTVAFMAWFNAFQPYNRMLAYYREVLRMTISRPVITVGLLFLLGFFTYTIPFQEVGLQQMPSLDLRQIRVRFTVDPNYGEVGTKATVEHLTAALDARREQLGISNVYVRSGAWGGEIRVYLVKPETLPEGQVMPYTTDDVRDMLSVLLPATVPGALVDCGVARAEVAEEQRVTIRMNGDDSRRVREYAEAFSRQLEKLDPEVLKDVKVDKPDDKQEVQVDVDEDLAASMGATPLFVARTVDFAMRGTRLPPLKPEGEEIPVWARFRSEDRSDMRDLMNVSVPGMGGLVPLGRIASLDKGQTPPSLYRENGKNVTSVSGLTSERDMSRIEREVDRVISGFAMDRGYGISMGDRFEELNASAKNYRSALGLAVILIYIVMAALFESFILPLSILTTVPLAFIGVYWSMFLTETPLDTVALVGCILMCGIIVNNGIVMIDRIGELRREGVDRFEAVLQASCSRLRPVLMTTLTTILGTLPTAFKTTGESSALTSLGRAFVGGISAGTMLTLFIVPLFYLLVDDFQTWCVQYVSGFRSVRRTETQSSDAGQA